MKLKYALASLLFFLMIISMIEIFPVPPAGSFWYPWYSSEYFAEIDREYKTVTDAFLAMKTNAKTDLAFQFLTDLEVRNGMKIRVYNTGGERVIRPGLTGEERDPAVNRIIQRNSTETVSEIRSGTYYKAIPVILDNECRICHRLPGEKNFAGVISIERPFNELMYYTAERRMLFTASSLLCALFIFIVLRWDPDRKINSFLKRNGE